MSSIWKEKSTLAKLSLIVRLEVICERCFFELWRIVVVQTTNGRLEEIV